MMPQLHHFILCIGLMLTLSASQALAQNGIEYAPAGPLPQISTPDEIKDLANKLYSRCRQNPDNTLNEFEVEEYCTCLSVQLYNKQLTHSERLYLATGEGPRMDEKQALVKVYSHCLGIPAKARIYYECTHNQNAYSEVKKEQDLENYCHCIVGKMSDFLDKDIPALFAADVKKKLPMDDDPLEHLMTGRWYVPYQARAKSSCISIHGRRD
ncbi:MAG: hypothetical protein NDJ24_02365 [Alphaproteobacteria bacterium]|nr:hypothetical protein [Alphaproteobacteria bacterium]